MRLTELKRIVRQQVESLDGETAERKLFEAWAKGRATGAWQRVLERSRSNPGRYAVEQNNVEFEAFVLGLLCARQGVLELQALVQTDQPLGPQ